MQLQKLLALETYIRLLSPLCNCFSNIYFCLRHRCPHKPTRIYGNGQQPCLTTEYVEKYPKYSNISPPRSLKPKQEYQVHRGKMEGITTFK
uniref:Uncharacterized protein n=1 Tax=Calidris pygmaea TaxID=425635 RepID=A0A8C3J7Q6_9CHAR